MKRDHPPPVDNVRLDGTSELDLKELVRILRRGRIIIVGAFLATTIVALVYTFLTKPIYESTARVLIDTKAQQPGTQFLDFTGLSASSKVTNELETLSSVSMAESVAGALLRTAFIDSVSGERIPVTLAEARGDSQRTVARVRVITDRLLRAVEFSPIKESDIVKITAKSADPREAALIANAYTEVYANRNISTSRSKSKAIREFMQSLVAGKKNELDSAENALKGYMRQSGMVSLDGETKKVVDQLAQLEATRDAIDVDVKSRSKTLESYKQELATQEPTFAKVIGESNDAYIRIAQEQLAKLEAQRDMVTAQNPVDVNESVMKETLGNLDKQIAVARKNLQARTATYVKTLLPGDQLSSNREGSAGYLSQLKQRILELQIELDGLKARRTALNEVVGGYERQFNQIPQKSIQLAKLQRTRASNEKLYLLVEEKFNEAAITETSDFGYVQVVDPGVVPLRPSSPKLWLNLVIGMVTGLVFGIGFVLLRASLDTRIKMPEDLKRHGYITLAAISKREENKNGSRDPQAHPEANAFDAQLISFYNPLSPSTESYRHLHTNVNFARVDRPIRRVLMTSPNPGEGKSTTIANLAVVTAQSGEKVLLIDADMRRPALHTVFGFKKGPGFVDVLFGKASMDAGMRYGVVENLDVLCCGSIPPNPAAILNSKELQLFIERMSKIYDVVLFDSPPLLAVTDAAVLGSKVDGVILVVSAYSTKMPDLERATEFIAGIEEKFLGVVLNNFDARKVHDGYHGVGYGYYGSAGSYYHTSKGDEKKR